jgi:surface carbohydrate biosynthesis protein
LLQSFSFEFSPRNSPTASYVSLDQSEIIVFTSSSLGYESLARGKKTAALMLDAEVLEAEALKFGWPAKLPDEGPFWTHQLSEQRLREIMDFLRTAKDHEWNQIRTEAIKDVIYFDPGNSQFLSAIESMRHSWQQRQSNN